MNIKSLSKGDYICGLIKYAEVPMLITGTITLINIESEQVSIETYDKARSLPIEVNIVSVHGIIAHIKHET